MSQIRSPPEVCAASAAILHKLTALIQLDSNRLHWSSRSLVCYKRHGDRSIRLFPHEKQNLGVEFGLYLTFPKQGSFNTPVCAGSWSVPGVKLPPSGSVSPKRLSTFSGSQCVHTPPVQKVRADLLLWLHRTCASKKTDTISKYYITSCSTFRSLPLNSLRGRLWERRWSAREKYWNCLWPARLLLWWASREKGFLPEAQRRSKISVFFFSLVWIMFCYLPQKNLTHLCKWNIMRPTAQVSSLDRVNPSPEPLAAAAAAAEQDSLRTAGRELESWVSHRSS